VLPLGDPGDLPAAIDGAESFYAARDLPAVFSVGDGAWPGLDGVLGARGYAVVDPTLVMTADLPGRLDGPLPGEHSTGLVDNRAVLRTLLAVARRDGARRAYLVVVERNAPARRLYEQEGFRVAGRYHYRVQA
jgi:GNAT superfamily N-acetyltransferase